METFLLEIGTEEIPAGYIKPALDALAATLQQKMSEARIEHGSAKTYGTPRRLAVRIEKVAAKQTPLKTELTGPPVKVGLDDSGKPTMAAKKFAEKAGVKIHQLSVKETKKGSYLCAVIKERGQATRTLLKAILPKVILATPFPKTMHWADLDIAFARPIHSCLALLGSKIISFNLGNVKANRYAYGHYFMQPGKIKIDSADDYLKRLKAAQVIVDLDDRRKAVESEINKAAQKVGGRILPDAELVDIVNNLVEYPVAVAGEFDQEFLDLPDEVLITAMREHQKYFAVVNKSQKLLPYFVAVNNTVAKDMKLVATGHERVLRARLSDAQFFYQGDLEVSNDARVEKLKGVLFQAKLGTMHDKMKRVARIGKFMVKALDIEPAGEQQGNALKAQVKRAAQLCKADLVSQVVGEFPKLQGVMGRVYATIAGEMPTVSVAIEEHYRPTYSGGPLPETITGGILSIADKIDTICGCFSAGLIPTGASDPYALRRQGIGMIQIMNDQGFSFSLKKLIKKSLASFAVKSSADSAAIVENVYTFLRNRIYQLLADQGYAKDAVAAVVDVSIDRVPDLWRRLEALESLKAKPDFEPLAVAFKRVVNILKKSGKGAATGKPGQIASDLFEHKSEADLYSAYQKVEKSVSDAMQKGLFEKALQDIATLRGSVDAFFDGVMVLAEDKSIRRNRLALLEHIAALFSQIADFSKLST
ncbi:MAG: glycine--tRNA ligase subunit beta [Desulfobacterales bacterium]|jgi:glycyl-tRNA synthetase beta chain|nr:glycine--tRNA ligase subunit beta [Deltaproteobacteria bacterium]